MTISRAATNDSPVGPAQIVRQALSPDDDRDRVVVAGQLAVQLLDRGLDPTNEIARSIMDLTHVSQLNRRAAVKVLRTIEHAERTPIPELSREKIAEYIGAVCDVVLERVARA